MRFHRSICVAVSVLATTYSGLHLFAVEPEKAPATQPTAMAAMDPAAMQAAWEKYATPGAEHKLLASWVGEWTTLVEDLTPGMGNEKSDGSAKSTMIMGGRYLQEEFKGTMMGMPFEGIALTGYDNKRGQYFSSWVDSMGTGMSVSYGTGSASKMELAGEMTCAMFDKPVNSKTTVVIESNDKRVMEMHMSTPDGTPMGAMRVTYTRKK